MDANSDADNDGLSLQQEQLAKTDPNNPDSDLDGVDDGQEIADKTEPLNASSNLLEIGFESDLVVGKTQNISLRHPVQGNLLGFSVTIIRPNGSSVELQDNLTGIVSYTVADSGRHSIVVSRNKFSKSANFVAFNPGPGTLPENAKKGLEPFFGDAVDAVWILVVLLLAIASIAGLVFIETKHMLLGWRAFFLGIVPIIPVLVIILTDSIVFAFIAIIPEVGLLVYLDVKRRAEESLA